MKKGLLPKLYDKILIFDDRIIGLFFINSLKNFIPNYYM